MFLNQIYHNLSRIHNEKRRHQNETNLAYNFYGYQ